ncbi:oligoribonuclease [Corynebacterium tuscaniense]|uniref:Oligoribonuclease n=1 Tax=Corynebacterium tuscaniense TaxID=302449 RepID=A0A2N6T7T7_9CORY|nr:oligoribonuclease [Corynebacterium tuscaniense]PMC65391.1 oligoribonuclease [Corynebacterium tuscaniense]
MNEALAAKDNRIVWIDLEMTGLEPQRHVIVEVAALVTDADLNILDEGIDLVVHASDEELAKMDDFVTNMHETSGLTEHIKASTITVEEAEAAVLELVEKHCAGIRPPLAGNSIATDRSFIRAYMPRLDERLHYRMIDVSTIKELTRRWFPDTYYNQPDKNLSHRALADIVESVRELDYYRRSVFTNTPGPDADTAATHAQDAMGRYQQFL